MRSIIEQIDRVWGDVLFALDLFDNVQVGMSRGVESMGRSIEHS